MRSIKLLFGYSMLLFLLFNCNSTEETVTDLNNNIADKFGVDSSEVIYQYYQYFGFTDKCEEIKMVSKPKIPLEFKHPLSQDAINELGLINDSIITFQSNSRSQFADIELEFSEFTRDSLPIIKMNQGSYEFVTKDFGYQINIYDSESNLLYIQYYECDGF